MESEQTELNLNPEQLQELTRITIGHYEFNAERYCVGTADHDVSQNYAALLDAIETEKPFKILNLGCGPGRDLKYFKSLGHIPVGVEGSKTFVEVTAKLSGCVVYHMDFIKLDLPQVEYDGIFANATLFHIPKQEIKRVMMELYDSLFYSNPRGNNQEGFSGERYGFYYDWITWKEICLKTGFVEVKHFLRPDGIPEQERPWLASVWKKITK